MRHRRRVVVVRMTNEIEYDPIFAWMLFLIYAEWCVIIAFLLVALQ